MTTLPPLVIYATEEAYRKHFRRVYCRGPVMTFDRIAVRFRNEMFDHCFFESVVSKDDTFSPVRAQRIDWIRAALEDSSAELFVGWDNRKKRPAKDRRVTIVTGNYLTIIQLTGTNAAVFITAFVADAATTSKVRRNPRWK